MTAISAAAPSRGARILAAIAAGGLTAGVFDFCVACAESGLPPLTIGRAVARGWYGKAAMHGGTEVALIGVASHFAIMLAKGAGAAILGFNVRASKQAQALAEREGVEIRYYAIIYDLLDDLKGVLSGMLAPIQRETFLGNAEVLEAFDISKVGRVAGCRVTEGTVRKGAKVRIVRDDVVIQEMGTLQTLKRFKDEVNEVVAGQECGMSFAGFQDIKKGDLIECFTVEEVKRTLA